DRAIDALDEACAHTQARTVFSEAAAALLADRRAMLRGGGTGSGAAPEGAGPSRSPEHLPDDHPEHEDEAEVQDPLERLARTGFDVLERFGAEIEAVIAGQLGAR